MANQNFDSSTAALKNEWRRKLKTTCQNLDLKRREQASHHACEYLTKRSATLRFVLSFASFGFEIDIWPFNQKLALEGRLILPRVVDKQLHLFHVTDMDHLEQHSWGFLEPKMKNCPQINCTTIDLALIPGLGFDVKTRQRLGYGLGYYDRMLSSFQSLQTCGIGFLEQAVAQLPHTIQDIPLKEIYLF